MRITTDDGGLLGPAPAHDDLDREACRYAAREVREAEEAIAALAAEAIRRWRLDEATFWQRVKFRARLLRAARGTGGV